MVPIEKQVDQQIFSKCNRRHLKFVYIIPIFQSLEINTSSKNKQTPQTSGDEEDIQANICLLPTVGWAGSSLF